MGRRDARSVDPRVHACAPARGAPLLTRRPRKAGLGPRSRWPVLAWCGRSSSRGGCGWCCPRLPRSSAGAGSPDPGRQGRRAPGRGRGRGAGAGGAGGWRGGLSPNLLPEAPGLRDAALAAPTLPAPSGGRLGDSPLPCAGNRLRVLSPRRALAARLGEARGSPAAAAASPARSQPVGGPWARRPGSARPGLCLRPLCVSSLGL